MAHKNGQSFPIIIAAAAVMMAAAVSCSSMEFPDSSAEFISAGDAISTFTASGTVYSVDEEPPCPISGIRVVMTSYKREDTEKQTPIARDTTYTDECGNFKSVLETDDGLFYSLMAEDIDGEANGGCFSKAYIDKIWPGNVSRLDNQHFYLSTLSASIPLSL